MTRLAQLAKRHQLILGLFVGYGFVVATLVMTALVDGRKGIRKLVDRLLLWRVGIQWYLVVLLGVPAVYIVALLVDSALGGTADFTKVYARRILGQSFPVWYFIVPFFLVDLITNGEEIGWRGYVLPRPFAIAVASEIVLATAVILTAGPARLSPHPDPQARENASPSRS